MPRKQNGGREEIVSGFLRQLNFQRHHLNQAKFSRWVYENNKLEHQFTTLHFTWQIPQLLNLEIFIPCPKYNHENKKEYNWG